MPVSLFLNLVEDLIISSDLIKQIQANYKASLSNKLKTLDALCSAPEKNRAELLAFLHQLAGSAGMYGYDQISAQCVELQSILNESNNLENIQHECDQLNKLIKYSVNS